MGRKENRGDGKGGARSKKKRKKTIELDEVQISRLVIQAFQVKLLSVLEVDVAMVGGGPANLTAGYYLGKAGVKTVILESKLAHGVDRTVQPVIVNFPVYYSHISRRKVLDNSINPNLDLIKKEEKS
jgi:heterodisulfide reductase subunit A-like polyferredoxin